MNKQLPSREQAINLLQESGVPFSVIDHSIAVSDFAKQIAIKLDARGQKIDLPLVEVGAILHDIGRSKTNTVDHSIVGARIAQSLDLPQPIIDIIKRHVGAGIVDSEAKALGWPEGVYVPQTLEEKVICYADKRIDEGKIVPIEIEIERLQRKGKKVVAERVRSLHEEITTQLGEML